MKKQIHLATNLGRGGISSLVLSADEITILKIDNSITTTKSPMSILKDGEIIYGTITEKRTGQVIDEVVVCAYSPTQRIITGHGGSASALAILDYYKNEGFSEVDSCNIFQVENNEKINLLQNMLTESKTETQAFHCIQAINKLKNSEDINITSILNLLRPRIVVLAGAPNVGKSSLLNILCGYDRVLVSDIAGTTRDAVKDYLDIGGYYTHIIDTAGFRDIAGESEQEAIRRGKNTLKTADVVIFILDSSRELSSDDFDAAKIISSNNKNTILPVINKSDLPESSEVNKLLKTFNLPSPVKISCINNYGIEELLTKITKCLDQPSLNNF